MLNFLNPPPKSKHNWGSIALSAARHKLNYESSLYDRRLEIHTIVAKNKTMPSRKLTVYWFLRLPSM